MSHHERRPEHSPFQQEPLYPTVLPEGLAEALAETEYACLTETAEIGTVYVLKAPSTDIQSIRGNVPIGVRHELYAHPTAPVIRTVIQIVDQPDNPLAFETFTNVDDSQQRSQFAALAGQEQLYMLFFDETLTHRLTKVVRQTAPEVISEIADKADEQYNGMDIYDYNFDQAKADVIAMTPPF